jgi:hypothetical protein
MYTERLDRSQESYDLQNAVLAGFIKSWFWTTARRIQPHADLGRIIVLGTILFVGLFVGMLYLQNCLPKREYFILTLGPLGALYVFQQNLGWLRRVWENKSASSLVATPLIGVVSVICKVLTDQQIRDLTDFDPSLFPSGQLAITALNIVEVIPSGIGIIILLSAALQFYKAFFAEYGRMFLSIFSLTEMLGLSSRTGTFRASERLLAKLWAGVFFCFVMHFLNTGFAEVFGKPYNPTELFLVGSSFISNDHGLRGSSRCINLTPDTLVSPFSTKDPVASRVVVAQPITTDPNRFGRSYTYRIEACSKPTDLGAFAGSRPRYSPDPHGPDATTANDNRTRIHSDATNSRNLTDVSERVG